MTATEIGNFAGRAATVPTVPPTDFRSHAPSDPSTRFILPSDASFLRNLGALWAADPKLAGRIEATQGRASYPTRPSKAGPPTVSVPAGAPAEGSEGSGSRSLFLHSRYEPIEEARRLVAGADAEKNLAFYVQGFALGYHVELLFERTGGAKGEAFFFVFEPDLLLLRTAFEQRDYSHLIESGRVFFFTEADKADLQRRLTPHTATLSLGVGWVVHPPSLQVAPAFHAQIKDWLESFASFARTSLNTLLLNSARTAENIARNVGWYAASPCPSRLRGRFAGEPALVVSAGPSLRKNKHLLKEAAGRVVMIAVQTTLQPLLEMGVEPHFVTSLDYHEICTRFFENLPLRVRTELVAEPKATSGVFRLNPGPLTLLGNEYAESLLREMKLNKATLPAGATVAHLAYYLAEYLGCDPILFVGQDLGFSDGLCYAPGTSYEDVWRPELGRFCTAEMKQWDQIVRERFILRRIPDYQGRPMYTEERLFSYLQQFEADFLRSTRAGRTIIDATEGGAAKRGTVAMPLAEAMEKYCRQPFEAKLDDHGGTSWGRLDECVACLRRRRDEAAAVEGISRETLPLLEEIRDHTDDQGRVNRAISLLDGLRARMNEFGETYDLVTQLTQKSQLDRFEADRRISAAGAKLDGRERQRRQVGRDLLNVRAMLEASVRFQSLMDEVIDSLSRQVETAAKADAAMNTGATREAA